MASSKRDPVLVVLQLSGGNDALNTIVPYADPHLHGQPADSPDRPGAGPSH